VSIVLLGTAGVSMLSAMTATTTASRVERDRSEARVWLRAAADELALAERQGCEQGEEAVRAAYLAQIRAATDTPAGWDPSWLTIRTPVKAWDGDEYRDPYDPETPGACYDAAGFRLQLVTLAVVDPKGQVIDEIDVVKG
jgi:hypothetical protein